MYIRYNFNRRRDRGKITQEEIEWKGPYCLFGYESQENPIAIPDVSGVYLFCFSSIYEAQVIKRLDPLS